jgi:multidrug resistance efflux pump
VAFARARYSREWLKSSTQVPLRGALSFILSDEIRIVGEFDQNGFEPIRRGADVTLIFANRTGEVFHSAITGVVRGTGQGQVAVSGTLARAETVGTSTTYPASIDLPKTSTWTCRGCA